MESTPTNASSSSSSSATGSLENIAATTENLVERKLEYSKSNDEMDQPGPSTSSAGAEGGTDGVDPLFERQKMYVFFFICILYHLFKYYFNYIDY